ncbi:hypothetical protein [Allonocardiopsis opalescens]|uniref:Uncharacterized protein n=1 Tax=Allonocardiopsis opalescens TaxID=1144618 RepID=A0A2T0PPN9_9ACTN|nr:hypothetical protein [Allonocardiopsis opalescens]PRX90847.1 hypothetical protein CLV72_11643 [Allonocardiopsis opalescens]
MIEFGQLATAIVTKHEPHLLDYGPEEQIARAVAALERFHAHTPLTPVAGTVVDLAGFGKAPVYFASGEDRYLLLSEVGEQLGMSLPAVCAWADGDHLEGLRAQREADERRGDGRLGYDCLRGLLNLDLWLCVDDPQASPDAGGRRWSFAGDWLISTDRIPALFTASPWREEFIANTTDVMRHAFRRFWGDKAAGNPLFHSDLTEDEARRKARRGPHLPDTTEEN